MSATERLQLLITANGTQAVNELGKISRAAKADIGSAERSIDGLSAGLTRFGAASLVAGGVAARGLYSAAEAAQGLADSVDKADATFGSASQLSGFADRAAKSMGLSKEAALDAASAYGLLLQQAGLGRAGLAETSSQLAQRTSDLAERFKKPYEEVQKAIENVLKTGSNKSLKGLLGIDVQIDPADIKGLDTAAKTTKIYQEILRQTADSANFFIESTDDMGVRFAQVQAEMKNAQADFGEAALPAITRVLEAGVRLFEMFDSLPEPVKEAVGALATLGTVGALAGGALSLAGGGLLKLIPTLKSGVDAFKAGEGASGKMAGALRAVNPAAIFAAVGVASMVGDLLSAEARLKGVDRAAADLATTLAGSQSEDPYADLGNTVIDNVRDVSGASDVLDTLGLDAAKSGQLAVQAGKDWSTFLKDYKSEIERFDPSILQGLTPDLSQPLDRSFDNPSKLLREGLDEIPASIRPVIQGLLDMADAGDLNGDQFRAIVESFGAASGAASATADDITKLAKALDILPASTIEAQGATADLNLALDDSAPFETRLAAAQRLAAAFPEATNEAGVLAFAIRDVDGAAGDAAGKVDKLATALDGIASGAPDALGAYADAMSAAGSAVDSVGAANDRLAAANKKLADLTNRDTAAIQSAYDRVIDAKQRLDDILAGDGNNLEQESVETQLARARAQLAEANTRLAVTPGDARAQTAKDEALADIERAISRRQELKRTADDTARQIRDAQKNIADAQKSYNEATQAATPEAIAQAKAEVAKAEEDRITALARFAAGVANGTVSVDAYKAELDRQVASGIISPEAAATLKGEMDDVAVQAGLAAVALGGLATLASQIDPTSWFRGLFAGSGAGGSAGGSDSMDWLRDTFGGGTSGGTPVGSPNRPTATGPGLPSNPKKGDWGVDRNGVKFQYNGSKWVLASEALAGRASGGPMVAGQEYTVGENGPERLRLGMSGYVVNAGVTAAREGQRTGAQAPAINAPITITEAYHPRETAAQVVRKLRSKQFLVGG